MTKIGVRGFYQITEEIESALLSDENVNTVTTGDITDIDLSKNSIYPISHVTVNNANLEENLIRFNISVISMDLVDVSKSETTDIFVGNNNEQDVLNTQLAVVNKLVQKLRQGTLYQNKFQLDNNPTCEFFTDRFDNQVAGVAATIDIVIPNDIDICN
jgi:hypothetical protein